MSRKEQIQEAVIKYVEQGFPDIFIAGFLYGAMWADSHPNWISVEDELPKENEEVLAYNSLFNKKYLCVYHNGKFEDYLGELGKGAVSHWMPIVPPRKEE